MNITILASGKPSLCKRFFEDGDVVRAKKAEMSSYFRFESRAVNDIDEFASLLTALEQDRSRFIIRGQLADDVDTTFSEYAERRNISLNAYCLMTNHTDLFCELSLHLIGCRNPIKQRMMQFSKGKIC